MVVNKLKRETRSALNRKRFHEVQLLEGDVRKAALERGFRLVVNPIRHKKSEGWHWMFNEDWSGRRVLDYWPITGTWYSVLRREKGKVDGPFAALELASKLACAASAPCEFNMAGAGI